MRYPQKINPKEAIIQMQAAAEDRLHPIADLSKIDAYKQYFLRCAKAICPGYIVRDDQRNILNDIVHWALKDYNGKLDPDRGLLLWGDIGTGKSTLLRIIRQFCHDIRPPKDGMGYWFRMTNVIDICAEFSDESRDGGYYALQTYITRWNFEKIPLLLQWFPIPGRSLRLCLIRISAFPRLLLLIFFHGRAQPV